MRHSTCSSDPAAACLDSLVPSDSQISPHGLPCCLRTNLSSFPGRSLSNLPRPRPGRWNFVVQWNSNAAIDLFTWHTPGNLPYEIWINLEECHRYNCPLKSWNHPFLRISSLSSSFLFPSILQPFWGGLASHTSIARTRPWYRAGTGWKQIDLNALTISWW